MKFEKYMNLGKEVEVDGEKYLLKALTVEHLPKFLKLMKVFSKLGPEQSAEQFFEHLDDNSIDIIQKLLVETAKVSFPEEWKSNEDAVKVFLQKNMMILLPVIFELNSADPGDVKGAGSKGEVLMGRLNALKKKDEPNKG